MFVFGHIVFGEAPVIQKILLKELVDEFRRYRTESCFQFQPEHRDCIVAASQKFQSAGINFVHSKNFSDYPVCASKEWGCFFNGAATPPLEEGWTRHQKNDAKRPAAADGVVRDSTCYDTAPCGNSSCSSRLRSFFSPVVDTTLLRRNSTMERDARLPFPLS